MRRRDGKRRPADLDRKAELARLRAEQGIERLLEMVVSACLAWIRKRKRPKLDPERVREAANRGLAAMVRSFREAMDRQDLTAAEVDRRMSWPAGRTERVLARPTELVYGEELHLAGVLGIRVDRCFDSEQEPGERAAGAPQKISGTNRKQGKR